MRFPIALLQWLVDMRIVPEIDQASLVLLGRFNPAIFQPFWFARHGIVGADEAGAAEIEINWLSMSFRLG
jgi:hypothetical protein